MKFLLVAINAKYIHSNPAVYSLKTYAEKYADSDNEIEIAEYTINQQTEEILRDIFERKPDVIGFSCYIWNIHIVKSIIVDYKKICEGVHIWVGGPEVSYNMEQVLSDNPDIYGVIYGEGEETFKDIIKLYERSITDKDNIFLETRELNQLNGIAFRRGDGVVITNPQQIVDLSDIPFIYNDMKQFENKIIYYETSRGCPFSCSYCLSSIDKKLRFRNLDMVKKELKFFIDNNTAQVKFVDRTFNCKKSHAMEIWKFIKENDNGVTNFHFEIAADLMTRDEIELISTMRPGLIQLEIGVQSTNEETLAAINRKTDLQKIAEVTSQIRENRNIHQHLDLIAGLPFEDYNSFAQSFNQVYSMKPDQLQLGFLKVLHGSLMEKSADKFGIVYRNIEPYEVLKTRWLSFEEILKLKVVEDVVEIYYNTHQFENTMKALEEEFGTAFELYEELGKYYKENSPGGEKHSRVTRYEILLAFIQKRIKSIKYQELLTLDFYLRENAKTRPRFASDIGQYKDAIREFFKSDKVKQILKDYSNYDSKQIEKMTHIEIFGMDRTKETYILFDYKNRNPLSRQAKIINITEWMGNQNCHKK